MTEIAPDFDAFIHAWTAARIGPLGDRTDPSDREFMIKRRAAELTSLAREAAALYSALHNTASRYGGVARLCTLSVRKSRGQREGQMRRRPLSALVGS
jgi:hypothetical protein